MTELFEILRAAGPLALAVVLGAGLAVVWKKLQALRKFYEGDPGDEKVKETPGRMKEERDAAQGREDGIRIEYDKRLTEQRKHYEDLIVKERDEVKALYRELNKTITRLNEEGGGRESDSASTG